MWNPLDKPFPGTSTAEATANAAALRAEGVLDTVDNVIEGLTQPIPPEGTQHETLFGAGPSGLSRAHARTATNLALQAAVLCYHHRDSIHYTQGGQRWEGINHRKKAWRGEFPHYGDCSSMGTYWLWNGLDHFHLRDIINHEHWLAGYTGTMMGHGRRVGSPRPGDLVIYGNGFPGEHVAMYTGGGLVVSHGSERGPLLLPMRYRSDVLSIRRYI